MTTTYQKNKGYILKWREENIDAYREYQRIYARKNYVGEYTESQKERKRLYYLKTKDRAKANYLKKKELNDTLKEFMNILLE